MQNRWTTGLVFLFWLTTMGWLVKEKLLPPLLVGEPPSFRTILAEDSAPERTVTWTLLLNGKALGEAITRVERQENGVHEIRNRLHLRRLPLAELTPPWLGSLVQWAGGNDVDSMDLPLDAQSSLLIDPLGRPASIRSTLVFGGSLSPNEPIEQEANAAYRISLRGEVEGNALNLEIRVPRENNEYIMNTTFYLPKDGMLGDLVSPQTRLPGLRMGQEWTVPVYSPLRQPDSPMEILHAAVELETELETSEGAIPCLLVVFRGDSGAGLSRGRPIRGTMWVGHDGTVWKQEARLMSASLVFERKRETSARSASGQSSGDQAVVDFFAGEGEIAPP